MKTTIILAFALLIFSASSQATSPDHILEVYGTQGNEPSTLYNQFLIGRARQIGTRNLNIQITPHILP